ncbi:MAG TPA: winged helix-turn-helix domain-containing protein, partial [Blastocatellia bacterium]|nr:winged helix-turn-helix domain-containing protein [Blastocatellia bacterium]
MLTRRFYQFGPFCLDAEKRVLLRGQEVVPLKPKAFDALLVLVQHHGQVLEKDDMMEMLWPDSDVEESNLPQHISALRKTLGEGPNE